MERLPRLHELSLLLRLGLTGLLLTLGAGYAASLAHMVHHHGQKDGEPGLSWTDLEGAYHGVQKSAPLLAVLDQPHGEQYLPNQEEREALRAWLTGPRITQDFDNLDLGERAPAEILARNCLSCHARGAEDGGGIGERMPLEYWDDVKAVAFSQDLRPVPQEILVTSTHTHALTMPLVALLACGLFLLTRWPRAVRHATFALAGLGCFLDVAAWWLARTTPLALPLLVAAGAAFGLGIAFALAGVLLDMWLPKRRQLTN